MNARRPRVGGFTVSSRRIRSIRLRVVKVRSIKRALFIERTGIAAWAFGKRMLHGNELRMDAKMGRIADANEEREQGDFFC